MPDILSFGTMNTSQNRFFWRGVYSAGTIYNPYDVVSYLGSSYISLTTQSGVLPTNTMSWDQMTASGSVTSVAGRVGAVTLSSFDLTDKDSANGVAGLDVNAFLKSAEFNLTINAQTGTTYTIVASDRGKLLTFNNASAVAVALAQATGSFASGWFCEVGNIGAGLVTITPTTSTVDGAATVTLKQFESVTLVSNGTNYLCLRSKVRAAFADITGTVVAGQITPTTATAHQFVTAIANDGTATKAQPAFSDISGTVAASQLPTPTASTLGGVQSFAAQTSKWINAISTAGVPSATQPTSADLAGGLTLTNQKFTSSGTFTIPTNVKAVKVTVVGGGGAGGGYNTFGGSGGAASNGDINCGGNIGTLSTGVANFGTQGAPSTFGGGGNCGFLAAGVAASAPGAGGGGAGGGAGSVAGGAGAAGVVIFEWVQ